MNLPLCPVANMGVGGLWLIAFRPFVSLWALGLGVHLLLRALSCALGCNKPLTFVLLKLLRRSLLLLLVASCCGQVLLLPLLLLPSLLLLWSLPPLLSSINK